MFLQAAIGGLALDAAIKLGNAEMIEWGTSVLTTAVLSIIITAPIGALAIAISGPLLLNRIDPKTGQLVSKDNENPEEASMLNKESTEPTEETQWGFMGLDFILRENTWPWMREVHISHKIMY